MPRFDGTGPLGAGPRTGRGLGPCGGGMAWGRGYGRGFGWCCPYCSSSYPRLTKKEEAEVLTGEAEILEEELKAVKERLGNLKAGK